MILVKLFIIDITKSQYFTLQKRLPAGERPKDLIYR